MAITKAPDPPESLSKESKTAWKTLLEEWELDLAAQMTLRVALEAWDRLQEARRAIDDEGPYYETETGFKREHPALKIEKEARSGFLMAWRMLNLGIEEPGQIGRPPG